VRGALKTLAILIVAAAVGLGISEAIHHRPSAGGPPPVPATTSTTTPPVEIVPGAGQAFVSGTVTSLTADNAEGPPLTPPFTITIPVRGAGSADLTGVSVNGEPVEIYWYGGQPLPVNGTGQLTLGGAGLSVNASGITWMLDGAARTITAGHFFLGSPVAVGTSGLATPEQTESFDAGGQSTMLTTGDAQVHLKAANLEITGPGSVTIRGALQVQTASGTKSAQTVTFGPGSYDIKLTPTAAGDSISSTLQGPVSAS
jgi:hypothetical protein